MKFFWGGKLGEKICVFFLVATAMGNQYLSIQYKIFSLVYFDLGASLDHTTREQIFWFKSNSVVLLYVQDILNHRFWKEIL